ncbi:hypothetical protein [Streptomyces sp. NPDC050738]|uniref:hypothetical protein n=1 Tax=Streptomyces sp. NPDC050738 TaxID=3154744 RepID=UPI00341520A8
MPFEDQLGDSLRRTGESFHPDDNPALVAGGERRGRRTVRRRRTAAVTGSVVALALVGFGGAYAGGVFDADGVSGGAKGASVAAPAKPSPVASPGGVTKEQVLKIFKGLLPDGKTTQETASGADPDAGPKSVSPGASLVFDDGHGKAGIGISISAVGKDPDVVDGYVTCPSKAMVNYDRCAAGSLPNGSRFMVIQGYEYQDQPDGTKNWRASVVTANGILLDANEYNAPTEKGSATTRTNPPLSMTQMKALVTSTAWKPVIASVKPLDEKPRRSTEPSAADVQSVLIALLPAEVKVADKGGQSGYGFVVVNDGKGDSLVQINVQRNMQDVTPVGEITTLPDASLLGLNEGVGEKGGSGVVQRTADVVAPDGFRVVISAFNTGNQASAATRAKPALTLAQLKAIALDPKWRALK